MKEEDIRPASIFNEYLKLCHDDIELFFKHAQYYHVDCPACGKPGDFALYKLGFTYLECPSCKTIYMSPLPDKSAFFKYYYDSASSRYWATVFYKNTEATRREKIWKPKALHLHNFFKLNFNFKSVDVIIDIGGGYGVFAEEMMALGNSYSLQIIEPSKHLASACHDKGLEVINLPLEAVNTEQLLPGQRCFTSFELFEHLHDPNDFLQHLFQLMQPGDLFVFSTLSGMGADIQTLWEHSKSIHPPHHLNFFNPKSIRQLLLRQGFDVLNITTPGQLDIDIMASNKHLITDHFWKNFLDYADKEQHQKMQEFLSENLLSSHMMIICQKPDTRT